MSHEDQPHPDPEAHIDERDEITAEGASHAEHAESDDDYDRREMLSTAVRFSAVVGALGLSVDALFSDDAEARPGQPKRGQAERGQVKRLIMYAIEQGNMNKAIKRFGKGTKLSEAKLDQLRTISNEDLRMLKDLQARFQKALKGIATLKPWQVHEHNAYRRRK